MDTNLLDTKFARIGARLKVADRSSRRTRTQGVISLDVQADRKGEFFEIVRRPGAEAEVAVLDVQPADRHLLLLVRENGERHKFLCGHDERHWFVAGIPDAAPVARTPPSCARASGSSSRCPASPWTRSWCCPTSRCAGEGASS